MLRWCRLKFLTKGSSVDVDKCYVCAAKAGDSYGTGYYFLASRVYCSINCFSEFTKKEMEKALNGAFQEWLRDNIDFTYFINKD